MVRHQDVESYLALLERQPLGVPFTRPSRAIADYLANNANSSEVELNRAALMAYIERFSDRVARLPQRTGITLSNESHELYRRDFERIIKELGSNRNEYYRLAFSPFAKDLGICSLRIMPAGAEIIDLHSGIGRRAVFSGGIAQIPSRLWYFSTRLHALKPLFQFHLHTNNYADFNEAGFCRFYLRVAEMLRLNEHVRGLFAVTWFVDPALEGVSPRLAYLRRPLAFGARVFCEGVSDEHTTNALMKSETRRRLYEQGKYQPKGFLFVWSRDDIIKWGRRVEPSYA